jgi:hypothetical protein
VRKNVTGSFKHHPPEHPVAVLFIVKCPGDALYLRSGIHQNIVILDLRKGERKGKNSRFINNNRMRSEDMDTTISAKGVDYAVFDLPRNHEIVIH